MKSILTLSLLAALALNLASFANGKGAERLNGSGAAAVTRAPEDMKCHSNTKAAGDHTAHGAVNDDGIVAQHTCPMRKPRAEAKHVGKAGSHQSARGAKPAGGCCK